MIPLKKNSSLGKITMFQNIFRVGKNSILESSPTQILPENHNIRYILPAGLQKVKYLACSPKGAIAQK